MLCVLLAVRPHYLLAIREYIIYLLYHKPRPSPTQHITNCICRYILQLNAICWVLRLRPYTFRTIIFAITHIQIKSGRTSNLCGTLCPHLPVMDIGYLSIYPSNLFFTYLQVGILNSMLTNIPT